MSSSAVIVAVRLTNVRLIECVSPLNELSLLLSLYIFIKYGSVPLGTAATKGHTETAQRLLELGANPNHQNKVITDCHIIIMDYTHTIRLKTFIP